MKTDGLSTKALAFCDYYAQNGNAALAASLAGFKHPEVEASRLLNDVRVQVNIRAKQQALAESIALTPEMIVAKVEEMATTDLNDLIEWETDSDGNMTSRIRDSIDIENPGKYISSITVEFGRGQKPITKVKFVDKQMQVQALGLLAKIKGMLIDKVETSGSSQVNVVIDYGLLENPDNGVAGSLNPDPVTNPVIQDNELGLDSSTD